MNQRKFGIALSYLTLILNTVIGLFFTPFLIRTLGDAEYGLYQLVQSFAAYLVVVNCGTGTAMTRNLVKFRTKGEEKNEQNYIVHNFMITVLLMLIILCAGAMLYRNVHNVFPKLTPEEVSLAKKLFILMIINIALAVPSSSLAGIITASEKFAVVNGFQTFKIIIRIAAITILLFFNVGSVAIISVDLALTVLYLLYTLYYCFIKLKTKVKFYYFDIKSLKDTFIFSIAIFLQAVINQLNHNVDRTVLGIYRTTSEVALYSVAMNLYVIFTSIPGTLGSVFLPKMTKLVFKGSDGECLSDQVIRVGRYQFMIGGAALCGFALVGKHFIKLWVGESYFGAWYVSMILMFPYLFVVITGLCATILDAKKKRMAKSVILLFTAILNAIVTVILVKQMGYIGAPIGTAFATIVGDLICMNLYYSKVIGLNIKRIYREILHRICVCVLIAGIPVLILNFVLPYNLWGLLIKISIYIVVYAPLLYFFGCSVSEKNEVLAMIHNVMQKLKLKQHSKD